MSTAPENDAVADQVLALVRGAGIAGFEAQDSEGTDNVRPE